MNIKRYVISAIAVFIFVFLYEFLAHGIIMRDPYEATMDVWRPQEEANMAFMALSQLLYSAIITCLFTKNFEAKGIKEGIRFGLIMGLLFGSVSIGTYVFLPIPMSIMISWVAIEIFKGLGVGIVLSLTYKK